MDERPDVIREQIAETRAALTRDLSALDAQISAKKEMVMAQAQWWAGVSAIVAGAVGVVWLWPRGRSRRPAGFRPTRGRSGRAAVPERTTSGESIAQKYRWTVDPVHPPHSGVIA